MSVSDRNIRTLFLFLLTAGVGIWLVLVANEESASPASVASLPLPGGKATWKYIVLHHSATTVGNASSFGRYHKDVRGWEHGLGYHFVIGNGHGHEDGGTEVAERWLDQLPGAHAGDPEVNLQGIGICLVGDFDHSQPTRKQLETLGELLARLCSTYEIPPERVLRHSDVAQTDCPGTHFPFDRVIDDLRARLAAGAG